MQIHSFAGGDLARSCEGRTVPSLHPPLPWPTLHYHNAFYLFKIYYFPRFIHKKSPLRERAKLVFFQLQWNIGVLLVVTLLFLGRQGFESGYKTLAHIGRANHFVNHTHRGGNIGFISSSSYLAMHWARAATGSGAAAISFLLMISTAPSAPITAT